MPQPSLESLLRAWHLAWEREQEAQQRVDRLTEAPADHDDVTPATVQEAQRALADLRDERRNLELRYWQEYRRHYQSTSA